MSVRTDGHTPGPERLYSPGTSPQTINHLRKLVSQGDSLSWTVGLVLLREIDRLRAVAAALDERARLAAMVDPDITLTSREMAKVLRGIELAGWEDPDE